MPSASSRAVRTVASPGVLAMLDAELGFVRGGGEKPGEVEGRIEGRGQQQGALEKFDEALADQGGFLAGIAGIRPELGFIARQAVCFQLDLAAFGIAAHLGRNRGSW